VRRKAPGLFVFYLELIMEQTARLTTRETEVLRQLARAHLRAGRRRDAGGPPRTHPVNDIFRGEAS
jgi:hypothetical protein